MRKLNHLNLLLSKKHKQIAYFKRFRHKQMRFLVSKLILFFVPDTNVEVLYEAEAALLKGAKSPDLFLAVFARFPELTKHNYDWDAFAHFVFYCYQTSTYWSDIKRGRSNIYSRKNFVALNAEKRSYFYRWLDSVPLTTPGYNKVIRFVMKLTF